MSNSTKERQYAHMAHQLQLLQSNLAETSRQLEVMSRQCNENIVGQLGKIHASWFMASNRHFEEEMLGKGK
ncbi:HSK3 (YKL138C-A) [Zygosaccharomyces parabailii]|uniref:ZYBA0S03-06392g1_1 n=1 Tax=Zygosaccharomyces bailii (strain CLIB 213 / ATCC 58445 / CBS 680 / BCRC 21525 / NBRC 1098 / NCYC 1416 / NRRL Y-2227) TaxID=1333698 RepID=A0A8J2T4J7_ZYGB2|nr:HSK3 (YKL138C-A) [Zygosaccharomyces parabailii]CDF88981.1 ZYBA0S03-06392g1_1 [Zygosaccharomyces bailii CLIB 213]SJM83114.1 probable DASH complex subunit HSK3 [Zygosaccharomyces bailii]